MEPQKEFGLDKPLTVNILAYSIYKHEHLGYTTFTFEYKNSTFYIKIPHKIEGYIDVAQPLRQKGYTCDYKILN